MNVKNLSSTDLQTQSDRLSALLQELRTKIADVEADFDVIRAELAARSRPAPEPRISDHALLRYIQRIHKIDVDALRQSIMTPAIVAGIKAGASTISVAGASFKVANNVIVTVLEKAAEPRLQNPKKARDRAPSLQEQLDDMNA